MQKLTRAEEEIMHVLWKLKKAFLKDILDALPEPKPAQSTVSTILKILSGKEVIAYRAYGRNFEYYPLIEREAYLKFYMRQFVNHYFEGSFSGLMQFFHRSGDLNLKELNELLGPEDPTAPPEI